jgi:hypothetical protein
MQSVVVNNLYVFASRKMKKDAVPTIFNMVNSLMNSFLKY